MRVSVCDFGVFGIQNIKRNANANGYVYLSLKALLLLFFFLILFLRIILKYFCFVFYMAYIYVCDAFCTYPYGDTHQRYYTHYYKAVLYYNYIVRECYACITFVTELVVVEITEIPVT